MPYTMEDLERDYVIDALPMLLKEETSRERILAVMADNLSKPDRSPSAESGMVSNPWDNSQQQDVLFHSMRETVIKTIGRILRLRFQIEIDRYRRRLEALPITELDELGELAETAASLAEFEARLPG